jgi:hypothetical protein
MNGLVISTEKFKTLTPPCQNELLQVLGLIPATAEAGTAADADVWPTKLSASQTREFWTGLGEKTRALVKAVVEEPQKFNVGAVLKKNDLEPSDLRGMLAGITKRIRTVTGNHNAQFFEAEVSDDDVNKCISFIHPDTRAALRRLLKLT